MRTPFLLFIAFCILCSCKSSKTIISDSHPIHALVTSNNIEFTATSASPMVTQSRTAIANSGLIAPGNTVSRIDLNGTGNFLKIKGDTVSANLPYFGERQFGGGYGTTPGIEFNGPPSNYIQEFNNDKQKYTISFQINNSSDRYMVYVDIFPNMSSVVSVNMANRNAILYNGRVNAINEEQ